MSNGFMESSKPFESFSKKAATYLEGRYPNIVGNIVQGVHIGRNKDGGPADRGGYRVTGSAAQARGNYLEVPDRILPTAAIANPEDAGRATFEAKPRVTDAMRSAIAAERARLLSEGVSEAEMQKRITDSIATIAYYDDKVGRYVSQAVASRAKDSVLSGLAVPYWNVAWVNKVFKQPFIQGLARNLVSVMGVPNIWADALVMYAETFEGMARLSGVARGNAEHNDGTVIRSRFEMLVSNFVNIVIDYETGFNEGITAGQEGNFLTTMGMGDREKYGRLMLEQLSNALILFGAPEAGFEGLSQKAVTELYAGTPLQAIWEDDANVKKGADAVRELLKLIGDMQEALSFLPSSVRVSVSPTVYKVLKFTMQSDIYSSKNPLQILSGGFQDTEMIRANAAGFGTGLQISDFQLVSDPFCAANTPWNDNASDLMFITFPSVKSALEPQQDLIIAPIPIENFILPNYPQRDGLQRTMMKRIGSLIAPIEGTVKILRGFGVQP